MNWYAAHVIMYVTFKDEVQREVPVWENIVLLEAESDEAAVVQAMAHGEADAGDSQGTFTWDGQPATWCFAGIRKLMFCNTMQGGVSGTEIPHVEMMVADEGAVAKLVAGESVAVTYC